MPDWLNGYLATVLRTDDIESDAQDGQDARIGRGGRVALSGLSSLRRCARSTFTGYCWNFRAMEFVMLMR